MNPTFRLRLDGAVDRPQEFSYEELAALDPGCQVADVSRLGAKRPGDAVRLAALLDRAGVDPAARYLGLHSTTDNFHASIPLAPIRERALLIYRAAGQPLPAEAGGPFRFFIPDHAACHTDEIDECANVKFVEHLELTTDRGFDNRPQDDEEHERLHRGE